MAKSVNHKIIFTILMFSAYLVLIEAEEYRMKKDIEFTVKQYFENEHPTPTSEQITKLHEEIQVWVKEKGIADVKLHLYKLADSLIMSKTNTSPEWLIELLFTLSEGSVGSLDMLKLAEYTITLKHLINFHENFNNRIKKIVNQYEYVSSDALTHISVFLDNAMNEVQNGKFQANGKFPLIYVIHAFHMQLMVLNRTDVSLLSQSDAATLKEIVRELMIMREYIKNWKRADDSLDIESYTHELATFFGHHKILEDEIERDWKNTIKIYFTYLKEAEQNLRKQGLELQQFLLKYIESWDKAVTKHFCGMISPDFENMQPLEVVRDIHIHVQIIEQLSLLDFKKLEKEKNEHFPYYHFIGIHITNFKNHYKKGFGPRISKLEKCVQENRFDLAEFEKVYKFSRDAFMATDYKYFIDELVVIITHLELEITSNPIWKKQTLSDEEGRKKFAYSLKLAQQEYYNKMTAEEAKTMLSTLSKPMLISDYTKIITIFRVVVEMKLEHSSKGGISQSNLEEKEIVCVEKIFDEFRRTPAAEEMGDALDAARRSFDRVYKRPTYILK